MHQLARISTLLQERGYFTSSQHFLAASPAASRSRIRLHAAVPAFYGIHIELRKPSAAVVDLVTETASCEHAVNRAGVPGTDMAASTACSKPRESYEDFQDETTGSTESFLPSLTGVARQTRQTTRALTPFL